ncbi:MAG: metallophosphatase family protein [Candidatus Brocadiales bacterium]|nr:metallophosphoesterase family protein [Candidatus Bathyanammoxibius sp.]MCQ4575000.1 metallophosphatase family protein [Candidatus Bathyanammoxibius amoris]
MKILIISDIHANIQALSAVRDNEKGVDKIFCLGDLVNYGPNPKEAIETVRKISEKIVRGNHDDAVSGLRDDCCCPPEYSELAEPGKEYTRGVLDEAEKQFLRDLPLVEEVQVDGFKFLLAHGSPGGNNCTFLPPDTSEKVMARELEGVDADFVFIGHTHMPMQMKVGKTVVVNPGSVGFPSGNIPKAAYAVWEDGNIEFKKVDYDISETVKALKGTALQFQHIEVISEKLKHGKF